LPVSHPKKRTRPSQSGTAAVDSPPSLPPVVGEPVTLSSDSSATLEPSEREIQHEAKEVQDETAVRQKADKVAEVADAESVGHAGSAAITTPAVPDTSDKPAKPGWEVKKGSTIHRNALKIMAMRMTGIKDKVIAEQLKISVQSVRNYVHQCLKSGLIEPDWLTAKERLEDVLLPKALQNLDYAMSDTTRHATSGMRVADQIALEVVKGTIFKEFDRTVDIANTNAIQINVVMPDGPEQTVREGAIAGVPAYADGEEV
jgi:hypothetical protein